MSPDKGKSKYRRHFGQEHIIFNVINGSTCEYQVISREYEVGLDRISLNQAESRH